VCGNQYGYLNDGQQRCHSSTHWNTPSSLVGGGVFPSRCPDSGQSSLPPENAVETGRLQGDREDAEDSSALSTRTRTLPEFSLNDGVPRLVHLVEHVRNLTKDVGRIRAPIRMRVVVEVAIHLPIDVWQEDCTMTRQMKSVSRLPTLRTDVVLRNVTGDFDRGLAAEGKHGHFGFVVRRKICSK